jgi:hypothetical protein
MLIVLGVMQRIVWHLPPRQFQQWALPVTRTLARALETVSELVAQASLAFWSRAEGARMLKEHKKVVLPIITPVVSASVSNHWSPAVRTAAQACLAVFQKHDSRLVQEIIKSSVARVAIKDGSQWKQWTLVAKAAQQLYAEINLSTKLAKITTGFKAAPRTGAVNTKPSSDESSAVLKPRLLSDGVSGCRDLRRGSR